MGARVIFNFKQKDDLFICLYSHWGKKTALEDLAGAIETAKDRWEDETYFTRIVTSQLIGSEWADTLGFGMWASNDLFTDEEWVLIDIANKKVTARDGTHTFEQFIGYHSQKVSA